jgi:hypothetical protein
MLHIFAIILILHGLIHLLGFAKGSGMAELPEFTQPVSYTQGLLWLLAAALFVGSAVALYVWPRGWWVIAAAAVLVSMPLILGAWADAWAGAIANALVLVGVVFGGLTYGPGSLHASYVRDVGQVRARAAATPVSLLTEADLAVLPEVVQRYVRLTGAVGQPRVQNYRVRMHGRIRSGPEARWMSFTVDQHSVVDRPVRLFYMTASMFGVPAQGLHRYIDGAATMRVKAAALVPVVDLAGPDMTRAETVTLFNDLTIMAPGALVAPAITWESADGLRVRAAFTNAGHTIRAELIFNDVGELVDFLSDDRLAATPDGRGMVPMPWSTPLREYRSFGTHRLASRGEGRWHAPDGSYVYLDLVLDDVAYNVWAR